MNKRESLRPASASVSISLPLSLLLLGTAFFWLPLSNAEARELQGRLGLGYNAQFAPSKLDNGSPAVAFKYALTRDLGVEGIAGVATTSPVSTTLGGKFFKNLFLEDNLNFYFMVGAGLLKANQNSGVQLLSGFGAEFFIPGLESIGLSMEVGGSFDNLSGSFALKTLGSSFLDAGMRFYF